MVRNCGDSLPRISLGRRLPPRNQQKQSPASTELPDQKSRIEFPRQPIQYRLEASRGRVQQQIAGAEDLLNLYRLEALYQRPDLRFCVSLGPGALQVIEASSPYRLPSSAIPDNQRPYPRRSRALVSPELRKIWQTVICGVPARSENARAHQRPRSPQRLPNTANRTAPRSKSPELRF